MIIFIKRPIKKTFKKNKKSVALFQSCWYYIHVLDSGIAQLVVAHDC